MRRSLRVAVVAAAAFTIPMTGADASTSASPVTTTPQRYVRDVCTGLNDWSGPTLAAPRLYVQTIASAKAPPTKLRERAVAMYATMTKTVDHLIAAARAIGVPRVPNGQRIARRYLQTLRVEREVLFSAQRSAAHARVTSKSVLAASLITIADHMIQRALKLGNPIVTLNSAPLLASAIQNDSSCAITLRDFQVPTTSGLKAGDCVTNDGLTITCDQPHDAEVSSVNSYPGDATAAYPGDAAMNTFVDDTCAAAFNAYTGVPLDSQPRYTYASHAPSPPGWADGDREVVCLVTNNSDTPLTGSIKGEGGAQQSNFTAQDEKHTQPNTLQHREVWA
jgi:Septum formation